MHLLIKTHPKHNAVPENLEDAEGVVEKIKAENHAEEHADVDVEEDAEHADVENLKEVAAKNVVVDLEES